MEAPLIPARHAAGPAGAVHALLGACSLLVALLVWQGVVSAGAVPSYELPALSAVWSTAWTLIQNGVLWRHVSVTLTEALLGFSLAFVAGAAVAYPVAKSPLVASILSPYVAGIQATPVLALAPLLMIWFGLGLFSKTVICAIIVFFPILVNTAVGLRTVSRDVLEVAWTEGASPWQTLWYIEAPLALPTILAGVRMGLTLSMTGAIVAEFVASSAGLGYLMELARSEYDTPLLYVAVLSMVTLAVGGYLLVSLLERLLVDWA